MDKTILDKIQHYLPGIATSTTIKEQTFNDEFFPAMVLNPGDLVDLSHAVNWYHRNMVHHTINRAKEIHQSHSSPLFITATNRVAQESPEFINGEPPIQEVDIHTREMIITIPMDFPVRVITDPEARKAATRYGKNSSSILDRFQSFFKGTRQ